MTTTKTIHRIANELVDDMARWRVLEVARTGYRGALPDGVSADDEAEFRGAVKDIAVCIEAGAVRVA